MSKLTMITPLVLLLMVFSSQAQNEKITYYTEDYPPSNYLQDGQLTGVSVETLKAIWQHLKQPEQEIHLVPWPRGYLTVQNVANTALFTMAKSPSRDKLFKWVGPIFVAEHLLIANKNFKFTIDNIEQARQFKVAAIKNNISEVALREQGFPEQNIKRITSLKQAMRMLTNDRIDLMIIARSALKNILNESKLTPADIKIVYSVNKIGNYYAFNLQTPDSVIKTLQSAFDEIYPQRKIINAKYSLLTP